VRLVRGSRSRSGRLPIAGACLAVVLVGVPGCATSEGEPHVRPLPDPTGSPSANRDLSGADLWLSFDSDSVAYSGLPEYPDALGRPLAGRVVSANGGTTQSVRGAPGRGMAVAFPSKCSDAVGCPRAMLEVVAAPSLDAGQKPFAYGASVRMTPDQTTVGSNILQKGRFGTAGGQWKLQVDGEEGRPSCVIRSGDTVLTVRSSVSVADGEWHLLVCRRDLQGLSVDVDGSVDRVSGRSGSVSNDWPITIGSPGVGEHDDQFHGWVDDVFLEIDSPPSKAQAGRATQSEARSSAKASSVSPDSSHVPSVASVAELK
jgi:hypothetical protein